MSTNKDKVNWLTGLLTGWGVKESWAKLIAGAIIGALIAAGALTQQSCESVTPAQIYTVHDLYRNLSKEPCIFVAEEGK